MYSYEDRIRAQQPDTENPNQTVGSQNHLLISLC